MLMTTFHDVIEANRRRLGLSFEQLSKRAWISTRHAYRICKGQAKPSRDIVIRLGVAMNLSVEALDELLQAASYPGLLDTPDLRLAADESVESDTSTTSAVEGSPDHQVSGREAEVSHS